jgi:hypothetical protein
MELQELGEDMNMISSLEVGILLMSTAGERWLKNM